MNLLLDENIDRTIVARLRADGHSASWIAEMAPGVTDEEVLASANASGAFLITEDKGFGEMVFRLGMIHRGVLLVRLAGLSPSEKASILSDVLRERGEELLGRFSVLSPQDLRIRPD